MVENKTITNNRDEHENDSGYSEEEALIILKKRTKAQRCYRKANAAIIPDFIPPEERKATDCELRETQVFTPYHGLDKQEMWNFIYLAADNGFTMEQALAILHVNKYDLKEARSDLKIYCPLPSEWRYDRSNFMNAFRENEKYFHTIRDRFFPDRKVADMVNYYYTWKMERKKRKRRDQLKRDRMLKMEMKLKKTFAQNNIATSK